ncbi:MAG TPA: OmpA family protein, partial [Pyrinomonadaceae bacterium]|nr:OmpA family protein [Pyrinomonadaceae bacterium]
HDSKGDTHTQTFTTDLQAFGIIITAEPHFAVTQPSNLVCLENVIRKDTVGATEPIAVHYELVERGGYVTAPQSYQPILIDKKLPFDIYEAMNAVRIAADNGAEQYAPDAYRRAQDLLQQAEDYAMRRKVEARPIATVAREAAQQAQDALTLTLRRKQEERQTQERVAAAARQHEAEEQAQTARLRAEQDAAARAQAEQQAQLSAQQAQQAALDRQRAQEQADAASRAQQQAEAARQQALQQQQAAQAAAQQAQQAAQQAQQEKEQLRARLLQQFNTILQTRDTARGLITNLSDVLFAVNSYQLKPDAKLALARFAGIVQAYPGLHLQVEGDTDSTGSAEYNQRLSERRANS